MTISSSAPGSQNGFSTTTGSETFQNKTMQTLVGGVVTDSSTTGSDATLSAGDVGNVVIRLTNASLASIGGITAGTSGQIIAVENQTGNSITVNDNDSVASAANRIRTGTSGPVSMPANTTFLFIYDSTVQLWMMSGGSSSGGSGQKNYIPSAAQSTSSGWLSTNPNTAAATVATLSTDTTAANLPRASTTKTAFKILPNAVSNTVNAGTFTATNATPTVLTLSGTGIQSGYVIYLANSGGALPTGLSASTPYWVTMITSTTAHLSTSYANYLAGTFVAASSTGTGTQYYGWQGAIVQWTLDAADYNVKQQVQWAQNILSGATGDWQVDVYYNSSSSYTFNTYTRAPLSTDSSSQTLLPNLEGTFRTTFDAPGSSGQYMELRFQNVAATTHALEISDLLVGPGTQVQGAAVSDWQSYTPTISAGIPSPTNINFQWRRVGSYLEVLGAFTLGGTIGATNWSVTIPSGLTINNSLLGTGGGTIHILGRKTNSGANFDALIIASGSNSNTVFASLEGAAPAAAQSNNWTTGTTDTLYFAVPINEWAGAGTVNVVQNDVEYAYNTGNVTSAGGSDTTSFAYGPAGTSILAYNSATGSQSETDFTVQWRTPVQATDVVVVEVFDTTGWIPAYQRFPFIALDAFTYGITGTHLSSTTFRVGFGNGGATPESITSLGTGGQAWSNFSSWKWRVRKTSAGAAVGFGIAQPGVSAGLIAAAGVPGNTTGNAIATGYVGEYVENYRSSNTPNITSGAWTSIDSGNVTLNDGGETGVTLTPGIWDMTGWAYINPAGSTVVTNVALGIGTAKGTSTTGVAIGGKTGVQYALTFATGQAQCLPIMTWRVIVTSTTTYYFKANITFTTSTCQLQGNLQARRIA